MFGAITPTIIGNLTADPELFFSKKGEAGVHFTVACNDRYYDKDAERYKDLPAVFMRCTAWGALAEHISDSLSRGMTVIGYGRLKQSSYTVKDSGEKRTVMEMTVDVLGPSLQYATAVVTKASRTTTEISEPIEDPWGAAADQTPVSVGAREQSAPESDDDKPPF